MADNEQEIRRSSQTYLRVAAAVLETTRSPLSAREIVERGIERGLFSDHALSRTPEKSMQARLSLDIKHLRENSRFMRVARGRFILREKLREANGELQPEGVGLNRLSEYIAEPRVRRLPSEAVLCTPEQNFLNVLTFQGIDGEYNSLLPKLLASTLYVNRAEAEGRNDCKQFITYVIVQCGHRLLSYRRSYLSRAAQFLRGSKCVGFGGHVTAADKDIFSNSDGGLETCARRELSEELLLGVSAPEQRAREPRLDYATASLFRVAPIECLGILNDDSSEVGRRHLAVVYRVWLDNWGTAQRLRKGESSLRSLNWIDLTNAKIDITEYEYWSQLCLRQHFASSVLAEPVVKQRSRRALRRARFLIVSGRIGSGKSEVCRFLAQKLEARIVNSGEVIQEVMGAPPISEIGREEFQLRAENFIRAPGGPERLALSLAEKLRGAASESVIIDGIRQPETFHALEGIVGERPALVYVHTPPDVAYEMYRLRENAGSLELTYRSFLRVYDASVEADLTVIGRLADTYVYNFLGIDALRRSLERLVNDLI